jgi:hypothetical protein
VIGEKHNRLTVVSLSHSDRRKRKHWLCRCDCGVEKTVQGTLLTSGNTRSCGCLSREIKAQSRLPNDRGVINHIILQYKRHATGRGLKFLLAYEAVEKLVRAPCAYCGIVGGNLKKTKNFKEGFRHNGIDRVDSSADYTPGNVVPCCGLCNRVKRDMDRGAFIAWALRVASHQQAMADQWGSAPLDLVTQMEMTA